MEDNKVYFVAELIDGTIIDFDCKCDYIENTSPNMCLFLHKKEECYDNYALMAAIPYNQIRYIKRCGGMSDDKI